MDLANFVYLYLGLTALLLFVLLFGDYPAFQGTPVSYSKWLFTEGWLLALERIVDKCCGERGLRILDRAIECFCESSNPVLQITYITTITAGYGLYWQYVFRLLPTQHAAEHHIYTGTAAVCAVLSLFLQASFSEPGRVTADTAAACLAAYPPDGVLFAPKQCSTCALPRPGRSRHCSACGSCVVRFDHHCGWINNCIGLANMRHFLAFLAGNTALCGYGVWLALAALAGDLQQRGFFDVYVYDPVLRDRVALHTRPARFLEWVMVYYPIHVALVMFMAVTGLLLLSFLLYQAYLISVGRTTYETLKRNQLLKESAASARQQGSSRQCGDDKLEGEHQGLGMQEAAQQRDGSTVSAADVACRGSSTNSSDRSASSAAGGWHIRLFGWRQQRQRQECVNYYDRGFRGNWSEVLWPDAFLQRYSQQLAGDAVQHSKQE
ncbi:DHHC palmitoyltransferase-domain-containing protein [Scenedesmus sp. NREL 46B-D3]|nr:DHHC palmitoyltransferase-domain-containing protein [Scenedesmus sp. NREL 46B-D3]